ALHRRPRPAHQRNPKIIINSLQALSGAKLPLNANADDALAETTTSASLAAQNLAPPQRRQRDPQSATCKESAVHADRGYGRIVLACTNCGKHCSVALLPTTARRGSEAL